MNKIYDIMVVGASIDGVNIIKELGTVNNINILFISEHFNLLSDQNIINIDLVKEKIIFTNFNHGLISLSDITGKQYFGKQLIVATGDNILLEPNLRDTKIDGIYYRMGNLKTNKNKPLVIAGTAEKQIDIAIKLVKKFKFIYLCDDSFSMQCTSKTKLAKLKTLQNIVFLPNCRIKTYNHFEGQLKSVTLSAYNDLITDTVLVFGEEIPDSLWLNNSMITRDSDNYINVNTNFETEIIPEIYALGKCTKKSKTNDYKKLFKYLRQKNNWNE